MGQYLRTQNMERKLIFGLIVLTVLASFFYSFEGIMELKGRLYLSRGVIYANQGQFEEAATEFTKATKYEHLLVSAYNNRASAYFNLGNYEKAIEDCDSSLKLKPNDYFATNLKARALYRLKRYDEALQVSEAAIKI